MPSPSRAPACRPGRQAGVFPQAFASIPTIRGRRRAPAQREGFHARPHVHPRGGCGHARRARRHPPRHRHRPRGQQPRGLLRRPAGGPPRARAAGLLPRRHRSPQARGRAVPHLRLQRRRRGGARADRRHRRDRVGGARGQPQGGLVPVADRHGHSRGGHHRAAAPQRQGQGRPRGPGHRRGRAAHRRQERALRALHGRIHRRARAARRAAHRRRRAPAVPAGLRHLGLAHRQPDLHRGRRQLLHQCRRLVRRHLRRAGVGLGAHRRAGRPRGAGLGGERPAQLRAPGQGRAHAVRPAAGPVRAGRLGRNPGHALVHERRVPDPAAALGAAVGEPGLRHAVRPQRRLRLRAPRVRRAPRRPAPPRRLRPERRAAPAGVQQLPPTPAAGRQPVALALAVRRRDDRSGRPEPAPERQHQPDPERHPRPLGRGPLRR
ncbi:hypothetical protein ACAN107058_20015 [Paracidovorax anthurii]